MTKQASRKFRPLLNGLALTLVLAQLPGCGEGESEAPPPGSAEMEAAKKDYAETRRMEYGAGTVMPGDQPKAKAKK